MVRLLYIGKVDCTGGEISIPEDSGVQIFDEPKLQWSFDRELNALTLIPPEGAKRDLIESPHHIIKQIEFNPHKIGPWSIKDGTIIIPRWVRADEVGDIDEFRPIEDGEIRHLIGRYDETDAVSKVYVLTYPELILGTKYHNENVNWTEESEERLRQQGFNVLYNWYSDIGIPLHRRMSDIRDIKNEFKETDELIRESIRDLRSETRERVHQRLVRQELGTSRRSLDEQLRDVGTFYNIIGNTEYELRIEIGNEAKWISFIRRDGSPFNIEEPELLWDCSCYGSDRSYSDTDWGDSPNESCPIHDSGMGAITSNVFKNGIVEIEYDTTSVFWYNSKDLWPPSMDTIRFYDAIRSDLGERTPSSVLDVGTGTGFLAAALGSEYESINRVVATDWLVQPVVLSAANIARNLDRSSRNDIIPRIDFGIEWVDERDDSPVADICVSNPPYLPIVDTYPELRYTQAVAGTDLLTSIIKRAGDLGETVYVNFSEIASDEAEDAAAEAGVELTKISEHSTPFRVPPAIEHDEYLEELKNRGLDHRPERRHPYWHQVSAYRIQC
jgi:methylase of polypeptide subunit release factors